MELSVPGTGHFVLAATESYGLYKLLCSLVRFRFLSAQPITYMKLCRQEQKYVAVSL